MTQTPFVFYGTAAWDAPWLTEQNLANALAEERPVLYVEPPITPLAPVRYGFRRESVPELRRLLRRSLRRSGRVHVLRPLAVPPREHAVARRVSTPWVRWQIARAVERLGFEAPVVVAAHSVVDWLGAAGERASVYLAKDLVEAGSATLGKSAAELAGAQKRMCGAVSLVCAVTPRLQASLAERGVEAELLPHGFHVELAHAYDTAAPPADLRDLPRPILGYTGRIDHRLDFAAIAALARRFEDGSIVLVGPVSPRLPATALDGLRARDNVHLLGTRSRAALPSYVRQLDVCVMPYREDEWLRNGSPLKLWDYLYAGPPVIGSGCEALLDYPLVRYASPPSDLPELAAEVLASEDLERDARRAFALANTWADRGRRLVELIGERVPAAT